MKREKSYLAFSKFQAHKIYNILCRLRRLQLHSIGMYSLAVVGLMFNFSKDSLD